ncbi:hypothetical protein DB88DRAFT_157884 [Papiliotrema laurentii]|uniref:Uncharacterized protein n=1 Tax=Papiliotrema laurentii TaxID=5418 RepID=A0AAD9FU89_PAPLA|nr:hypothetical protein DB88DRAFT_157884 [Papiliotrema laurentii]
MSARPATNIASEVSVLQTKAAAKKGLGVTPAETETTWPKPEWGDSMQIDNVTLAGRKADGFIIPAGSMFPLGCAIPNHTVLRHGMYFPPGTMFPDGVLVPIHARMVSVQPIKTKQAAQPPPEAVCLIM